VDDDKRGGEVSLCAGTPMYQAPEQTMNEVSRAKRENTPIHLTDKTDMFAAGLILFEMCSDFGTQHQRILKFHTLKTQRWIQDEKIGGDEKQIILNLTDPDPNKRLNASSLLSLPAF